MAHKILEAGLQREVPKKEMWKAIQSRALIFYLNESWCQKPIHIPQERGIERSLHFINVF